MDTLANRIKSARKAAKITQAELANRSGLKQGTIAGLESGKSSRTTSAAELSAALGVNMEWLATGKGDMNAQNDSQTQSIIPKGSGNIAYMRQISTYDNLDELPDDNILITVIDAKLSAGHGRDNPVIDEKDPLPFSGAFIKQMGIRPKNAVMLKIDGDSMEPTLFGGNSVLIDKGNTTPTMNGEVFALIIDGEWMVKRLYKRVGGGLVIESDNKNGKFFNADWDEEKCEIAGVDILGRVRYQSGIYGRF